MAANREMHRLWLGKRATENKKEKHKSGYEERLSWSLRRIHIPFLIPGALIEDGAKDPRQIERTRERRPLCPLALGEVASIVEKAKATGRNVETRLSKGNAHV